MSCQVQYPTSKKYLTDDEILEVAPYDRPCSFRLRIWRSKASPAIVLISQLAGGVSPSWSSSYTANLVHRAYLGFPEQGMNYFEDEVIFGERRLFFVRFRTFGQALRRCLTWPVRHDFDWIELEAMVGGEIPNGSLLGPSDFSDRPGGYLS